MSLRVVFLLYCLEAGIFFLLVPWTRFWLMNPLLASSISVHTVAANAYVRGLVSGFGAVHIVVGMREISTLLKERRDSRIGQ